jgi:hypothetical protein
LHPTVATIVATCQTTFALALGGSTQHARLNTLHRAVLSCTRTADTYNLHHTARTFNAMHMCSHTVHTLIVLTFSHRAHGRRHAPQACSGRQSGGFHPKRSKSILKPLSTQWQRKSGKTNDGENAASPHSLHDLNHYHDSSQVLNLSSPCSAKPFRPADRERTCSTPTRVFSPVTSAEHTQRILTLRPQVPRQGVGRPRVAPAVLRH